MSETQTPTITTSFGVRHSKDCPDGMSMLRACGGDFDIVKSQVSYQREDRSGVPTGMDSDGNPIYPVVQVPINAHVPVRSDTREHIANTTVGDGYVILQNREMIDIANAICGARKMNFDHMALLDNGRGLAIQVDCPELADALRVGKGDSGDNRCRLTMLDWHDGTGSLRLYFSMLRMFCRNTLPALGREFMNGKRKNRFGFYSIKHTQKMAERIAAAISTIQEAVGRVEETAEIMRLLADVRCTASDRTNLHRMIANPEGKDEREMTGRAKTMYENRMRDLEHASNMSVNKVEGHGGSWYEALQSVTYYGTHMQTVRGSEDKSDGEKRFASTNFGAGALTNIKGVELALSLSGVDKKL